VIEIEWQKDDDEDRDKFIAELASYLFSCTEVCTYITRDSLECIVDGVTDLIELLESEPFTSIDFDCVLPTDLPFRARLVDSPSHPSAIRVELSPFAKFSKQALQTMPAMARVVRLQRSSLSARSGAHLPLVLAGRHLHPFSLHYLVDLARKTSNVGKAALLRADNADGTPLRVEWSTQQEDLSENNILSLRRTELGLLDSVDGSTAADTNLWCGIREAAGPDEAGEPVTPSAFADTLTGQLTSDKNSAEKLTRLLRELDLPIPDVEVRCLAETPSCEFVGAPSSDRVLELIPLDDRVVLGIDFDAENPATILLHGVAHIALGHIMPGDDFGHWDNKDSIHGVGAGRRWDEEVRHNFPSWTLQADTPDDIFECSPREKAYLGLWRTIRRMLGDEKALHARAVDYQHAAYQREAAQRLINMLDNYSGGMLCDGVGLGKTYVATTLLVHYVNEWRERSSQDDPFRITILVPNSISQTWEREAIAPLVHWGVPLEWIRVISHSKLSRITPNSSVLQRPSRRALSDFEHLLLSDLVIVDEAHNFRSISANRTKVLRDLLRQQPRKSANRRTLLLTATPINNGLDDFKQELSLLFSRPVRLSSARTNQEYVNDAHREVERRWSSARKQDSSVESVAPLLIHGSQNARFSDKPEFRGVELDLGGIVSLPKYLQNQDNKLQEVREKIRARSQMTLEEASETAQSRPRIAAELLDRIVVQRSRNLCKQIEQQQGSDVELMFRPDAAAPERLSYADEYDGTGDVLASFLPLFDDPIDAGQTGDALSFKVYMWYDVQEGIRGPEEGSPAIGLQRVLALKRLESSPISFLISLLRLVVLHAHRLHQLHTLCVQHGIDKYARALQQNFTDLLTRFSNADLKMVRWLSLGDDFVDPTRDFFEKMSEAYGTTKLSLQDQDIPAQGDLFGSPDDEKSPAREAIDRLWELREVLLEDLETLLNVTPRLSRIIFGRFDLEAWPPNFIANNQIRSWPESAEWGHRLESDAKLRTLVRRLLLARRDDQKVIIFSQFTDTIGYIESVLRACRHLSEHEKAVLLSDLDIPEPDVAELDELIDACAVVTGDTDNRETVVDAFAPYYRIGPFPPEHEEGEQTLQGKLYRDWMASWAHAMKNPVHVLFTTDVLAEGVNLQDVALLINFDVHWNPVRMIQRSGRIDRRLNPRIEQARAFPDLDALAQKLGAKRPSYYWHERPAEAPHAVNMLLSDELEKELQLRERIAFKTLAIDFTLGLERGTGAEADWMENYRYKGVSALNAFTADRAIEQLSMYGAEIDKRLTKRGIPSDWEKELNFWVREHGADDAGPLLASAAIGRTGGKLDFYDRYLEPLLIDGSPHWLWTPPSFDESSFGTSFWLAIDGESWPPRTRKTSEFPPEADASQPLTPEYVLEATRRVLHPEVEFEERERNESLQYQVYQGLTAISAGLFGNADDRQSVECDRTFILQLTSSPWKPAREFNNADSVAITDELAGPPAGREARLSDGYEPRPKPSVTEETPRKGIARKCSVCGHTPGMHKCCTHCGVSADGEKNIDQVFGFRTIKRKRGRVQIPQPWCRRCRCNDS
jgi:hypothetical protein